MGFFSSEESDYDKMKRDKDELENEEMLEFFILGGLGIAAIVVLVSLILYFIAGWLDQTFGTELVPFLNEHLPDFMRRPSA